MAQSVPSHELLSNTVQSHHIKSSLAHNRIQHPRRTSVSLFLIDAAVMSACWVVLACVRARAVHLAHSSLLFAQVTHLCEKYDLNRRFLPLEVSARAKYMSSDIFVCLIAMRRQFVDDEADRRRRRR
jgi:hypothetical protein